MTRKTAREIYTIILEVANTFEFENSAEVAEFAEHQLELLNKRAEASRNASKANAEANEGLKTTVLTALANIGEKVTVTTLQKESPELAELSNQKISYLLSNLKEEGRVIRTTEKKKAYYSVA